MDYQKEYEKWITNAKLNDEGRAELVAIANDEKEIGRAHV